MNSSIQIWFRETIPEEIKHLIRLFDDPMDGEFIENTMYVVHFPAPNYESYVLSLNVDPSIENTKDMIRRLFGEGFLGSNISEIVDDNSGGFYVVGGGI